MERASVLLNTVFEKGLRFPEAEKLMKENGYHLSLRIYSAAMRERRGTRASSFYMERVGGGRVA